MVRSIREVPVDEVGKFPFDDYEATREIGQSTGLRSIFRNLARSRAANVRIAKALDILRSQINTLAPERSKRSDGWIGDAAHQAGTSDHNPWVREGGVGIVTALDITHDPGHGCDCGALVEALRASQDARIKYIIWNRRIANSAPIHGKPAWEWRPYGGSNPHDHHFHLSVKSTKDNYDADRPWSLGGPPTA
jgi:hypothetical protein